MFTRLRKYHKAFLISVTVLIAISFGMGTIILSLVSEKEITEIGSFKGEKVTTADFEDAVAEWSKIYRIAVHISPKARRIRSFSEMPDAQFLYTSNPQWDTIFSLREDIAKMDREVYAQLGANPTRWNHLVNGEWSIDMEEILFYDTLAKNDLKKLKKLSRDSLNKRDIWILLMLYKKAKDSGIRVTQKELDEFVWETRRSFEAIGGVEEYRNFLNREKIIESNMPMLLEKALTLVKYLEVSYSGSQVGREEAYNLYANSHTQYRVQWARFKHDIKNVDKEQYRSQRLAFYDRKQQSDPTYFQLPARADFEYVYMKSDHFIEEVAVTELEVETAYNQRLAQGEANKGKIREELKRSKARELAGAFLTQIYQEIASAPAEAPLESLALEKKMEYEYLKDVSEEDFLKASSLRQTNIYSDSTQAYIYQQLTEGSISPVLTDGDRGVYFVRLRRRVPQRLLKREEVEKDELAFLQRYYHKDVQNTPFPTRYRVGYVVFDHEALKQNLLITTPMKKEFFEKYKDHLYRTEGGAYQKFEDVEEDVEKGASNLLAIREMQNFEMIYALCKNPIKPAPIFTVDGKCAKDLDQNRIPFEMEEAFRENGQPLSQARTTKLENKWVIFDTILKKKYFVEKELDLLNIYAEEARDVELSTFIPQIKEEVLVPESLKYIETALLTREEIIQNNPTGDPDFSPDFGEIASGSLSKLEDSPKGRYFYKILQTEQFDPNIEFENIKDEVKEHFLKMQAMEQARKNAGEFCERYPKLLEETLPQWQDHPQRRSNLPFDLFCALAYEYQLSCQTTSFFETSDEIRDFKGTPDMSQQLALLKEGEVKSSEEKNSVLIFQLVEKKRPSAGDVPEAVLERIQQILSAGNYRTSLMRLVNYDELKKSMDLHIKDPKYEDFLPKHKRTTREEVPVEPPIEPLDYYY